MGATVMPEDSIGALLPFPSRDSFRDETRKLDVPCLDLHLMRMLAESGLCHREFFAQMCLFYKFPPGPFTNEDVLLKVMTETSLSRVEPIVFGEMLEQNEAAMRDEKYGQLVAN